ncbi:MAG: peptidylprolyl isomerase [Candidatus Micrarchaeia archaeon]
MAKVYSVLYEGRFEDGQVFDASEEGAPLVFIGGAGMVIEGFEKGIEGMEPGQEKEIIIPPEEGYGYAHKELIIKMPKSVLEGMPDVRPGMEIVATLENGEQVPVKVLSLDESTVTFDFNHPLAGKTLIFRIKLLDKHEATDEELEQFFGERNTQ